MKIKQAAFTLLELLVVISIIGILISLAVAGFTNGQKKSRDSRRKQDLQAVQTGFEQYYVANGAYSDAAMDTLSEYVAALTDYQNFLPAGAPTDPKNTGDYVYSIGGDLDAYCVCAKLESASGNASTSDCSFGGDQTYFCVKNLQ